MDQATTSASPARKAPRLSRLEIAGLTLLGFAVLQNQFRRRTATISMRAYSMRRQATMSVMPPGMTTALVARVLLERGSRDTPRTKR